MIEVLTPEQAAERLGVSVNTLARWRMAGDGPRYCQINARLIRYRALDINEWLQSRSVEPAKATD